MKRHIAEGLSKYINENHGVWHMPGHKRKPAYEMNKSPYMPH